MDEITKVEVPWFMMFSDDVVMGENLKELNKRLE